MFQRRHPIRSPVRSPLRRTVRSTVRTHWRAPDDLASALTSFRRALRAHRRLARLAPRFFDPVIVNRERREHEARCRALVIRGPALARAYGLEPEPINFTRELPPLPPLRTQHAVERELAAWDFWLHAGDAALQRYRQRRPHELMDWRRLAALLDLSMQFRMLACGFVPGQPAEPPADDVAAWADLQRAYGASSAPSPPASAPSSTPVPPVDNSPVPAPPGPTVPASTAAVPSPPACAPPPPRRDAWSRYARQLRQASD